MTVPACLSPRILLLTPTKSATNDEAGVRYSSSGRADLLDLARAHDGDAVGDGERLLLVVRDEERRDAELGLDAADLLAQLHAHLRVESRQRLVEQEHAGPGHESPGEGDALLLAARELVRVALRQVVEADHLERLESARACGRRRRPCASAGRTRRSAAPSCAGTASTAGRPCRCRAC